MRPGTVAELPGLTRPHPARPAPADGVELDAAAEEYDLFWSLSFALTAGTWERIGGFDEAFEGYGAEDTDFGWRARARGVPMAWVGGAQAYHQWHPTSKPPWRHLDDILRNGEVFARRWGAWPMEGWLRAFAEAGAVRRTAEGWVRADAGA
ncbi:galactosyltransferase-related protein [Rothia sp. AR01]|uniref:Galactosyltransferase-related protein n=1 Tax=Rothia santali TaxID=2949643 RepID=A0A9X2KI38_9MICC|nr:galactosyltransferase-related protein [Rothia santali]MCP3426502.1 galactosyltransferase-related protein [Rothia santali]